jgi:uncharacterized membrane protein YdbT with pleckstrin-like domain
MANEQKLHKLPFNFKLDDGETLRETIHGSGIVALKVVMAITIIILAAVSIFNIATSGNGPDSLLNLQFSTLVDMALVGIFLMVASIVFFIYSASTNIYVTDKRLLRGNVSQYGRGFKVTYTSLPLGAVSGMGITQDSIGRLFGYYSLQVDDMTFGKFTKDAAEKVKGRLQSYKQ